MKEWGFPVSVLERIGAFAVAWSIFETNLELALWALSDEKVDGVRPSTDKTHTSEWIERFGRGSPSFPSDAQEVLRTAASAANNLMHYRHSLFHGFLIPSSEMPTFIRNPQWHREVRKRPMSEAHVDENLLDMAIDAAWILCRAVMATREACADAGDIPALVALEQYVDRAHSSARELRYLAELVNHEKY